MQGSSGGPGAPPVKYRLSRSGSPRTSRAPSHATARPRASDPVAALAPTPARPAALLSAPAVHTSPTTTVPTAPTASGAAVLDRRDQRPPGPPSAISNLQHPPCPTPDETGRTGPGVPAQPPTKPDKHVHVALDLDIGPALAMSSLRVELPTSAAVETGKGPERASNRLGATAWVLSGQAPASRNLRKFLRSSSHLCPPVTAVCSTAGWTGYRRARPLDDERVAADHRVVVVDPRGHLEGDQHLQHVALAGRPP